MKSLRCSVRCSSFSAIRVALVFVGALLQAGAWAAEIPAGGEPLLATPAGFRLTTATSAEGASLLTPLASATPDGQPGWRVETRRDVTPPWAIELRAPVARAVTAGDVALLRLRARATQAADETGGGWLRVVVQRASGDYAKSVDTQFTLGAEWQEILVPLTFRADYAAGAVEVAFGFGYKRQTIEIAAVELLGYGRRVALTALPKTRFTYAGRAADAPWRRDALARIETLRKRDLVVAVRDGAGRPVAGADVRVEQRRSAFQFGTALQLARLVNDTPDNLAYRARALELFNAASAENDLKWGPWNGEAGPTFSREQTLAALRWLQERGVPVRGHVLVWPGWKNLPASIRRLRDTPQQAEIPQRVLAHIADVTAATRGLIHEWDVLNEPYDNHDLMALFGNDLMTEWFRAARAALPTVPLYLNDYANHDMLVDTAHFQNFYRTVIFLQKAGAPLGGLGLQGHIGNQPNPPEHVLATLELYRTFGLPVRITEFDIDTDDEALQADYTRDFLILAYSHPSVVGVQHWGFWERAHWRPRAALFRADWSEKPSAQAYRALVLDAWRTRAAGTTTADGRWQGRGFHGDYVVTVTRGTQRTERTVTLAPGGEPLTVEVALP